jgi:hypothetical protein
MLFSSQPANNVDADLQQTVACIKSWEIMALTFSVITESGYRLHVGAEFSLLNVGETPKLKKTNTG